MKKFLIFLMLLALVGQVSAVSGAKCKGNFLEYFDLSNKLVSRDCSILHSGNGDVFRGICKTYEGGADCWRTEGAVTTAYRDAVRGYTYNSSNVWDTPYFPPVVNTTPTTLPSFDITKCPACTVCKTCESCDGYKDNVFNLNFTLMTCETNYAACTSRMSKMVFTDVLDEQKKDYENRIAIMGSDIAAKDKEITRLTKNSDLYYYMALAACIVLIMVIGVWVKYEWIGDPKLKHGLGDIKN